jgi:hypothetical protein
VGAGGEFFWIFHHSAIALFFWFQQETLISDIGVIKKNSALRAG